jgi:hypothetical protein
VVRNEKHSASEFCKLPLAGVGNVASVAALKLGAATSQGQSMMKYGRAAEARTMVDAVRMRFAEGLNSADCAFASALTGLSGHARMDPIPRPEPNVTIPTRTWEKDWAMTSVV